MLPQRALKVPQRRPKHEAAVVSFWLVLFRGPNVKKKEWIQHNHTEAHVAEFRVNISLNVFVTPSTLDSGLKGPGPRSSPGPVKSGPSESIVCCV